MFKLPYRPIEYKCRLYLLLILSALTGVCTAILCQGCNTLGSAAVGAVHGARKDLNAAVRSMNQQVEHDEEGQR